MFDTHAHLNLLPEEERDKAVEAAREAGVRLIINPSVDEESLRDSAALSRKHRDVFFCGGLHPEILNERTAVFTAELLEPYLEDEGFLGIGEVGLDYFHNKENKEDQIRLLTDHLDFAKARDLPVVLHVRDAWEDIFPVLRERTGLRGEFHCFTGSIGDARKTLDLGFDISFSGILTYPGAKMMREVAEFVPEDHILLETDTPYLSPVPLRGQPNRPDHIAHLYEFYCGLKKCAREKFVETEYRTIVRLFGGRVRARVPG